MTLNLHLLGTPEITIDDKPITETLSTKAQAILYYLATTQQPQPRTTLATLLWGDVTESSARASLRKALAELRRVMNGYMDISRQSVVFDAAVEPWVDVVTFEDGLRKGDIAGLQAAVDLYRGDFLTGFYARNALDFEAWSLAEQARLRELAVQAMQTLASLHADQGNFTDGITYLRQLLVLEPWREEAHRHLMQLLAQDGQRSTALTQYETCRTILAEELGVEPGADTTALYEQIRQGFSATELENARVISAQTSQHLTTPNSLHRLPAQTTPFIGREADISEVVRLLREESACRLLTLVGAGGIGKTRFAIQVAQRLIERAEPNAFFDTRIIFVPLTSVNTTSGIEAAIATAANFTFYNDASSRQQLLDFMQEKQYLLILDNFEHLLEGAELVSALLEAASGIKMLITSREPLNLHEEWLYSVEGLPYPQDDVAERDSLESFDAIQLFIQRARRMKPSFSLQHASTDVVRICQLVEGMPLGIELAAAWLKMIPAEKIVSEIEDNLDILSTRLQNVPERHRSMRAVFEHSWQLLTGDEQDVLMQLSVFQGGFQQEAAELISGASFMTLATLVEKSLLKITDQGRYQLHELLRQFAAEKLADSPHIGKIQDRHSRYYLSFASDQNALIISKNQKNGLDNVQAEIDNIKTGWHWAINQAQIANVAQAIEGLFHFYYIRARFQEGIDLFEAALSHFQQSLETENTPDNLRFLARLTSRVGTLHMRYGDFMTATKYLLSSLEMTDDPFEESLALRRLGEISIWQMDRLTAEDRLRKSVAISKKIGDETGIARALKRLSEIAVHKGDFANGKQLMLESLAIIRKSGRPDWIADGLGMLAWCENCLGNYAESEALYRDQLAISTEVGDQAGVALALEYIAWSMYCIGEKPNAEIIQMYEKSYNHFS